MANEQANAPVDILLIDSSPGDVRLLTEAFRNTRRMITIHAVADGEHALEFIHQRGEYAGRPRPDLILLDPRLPKTPGRDVLSELNDDPELSDIPVTVLINSDAEQDLVRSCGLAADTYIRKPVGPEEFDSFVETVEDFWLTSSQEGPTNRPSKN